MKKKERYMSDEAFSVLVESLEHALQHARGERTDFRVTTGKEVLERMSQSAPAKLSVLKKINTLTEEQLANVDSYITFLQFQESHTFARAKAA